MYYELLVFWMLAVILSCTSMTVMMVLTKRRMPENGIMLLDRVRLPLLLAEPVYNLTLAQNFIRWTLSNSFIAHYDWSYLEQYLAVHLVTSPNGKLPKLDGVILFNGEHAKYTMHFLDTTDQRIQKYIKQAMKLLKESKPKKTLTRRVNVLRQANSILKSKRQKQIDETKAYVDKIQQDRLARMVEV